MKRKILIQSQPEGEGHILHLVKAMNIYSVMLQPLRDNGMKRGRQWFENLNNHSKDYE